MADKEHNMNWTLKIRSISLITYNISYLFIINSILLCLLLAGSELRIILVSQPV